MEFTVAASTAVAVWVAAVGAHVLWFSHERRSALAFLEEVIAASKPRPTLAKHVPPPPPVVGRWEYDHLPAKRLKQKPWFIP